MFFEEMSWTEVRDVLKKTDTALVPVGSIEQHGPHLPLNTDLLGSLEIAERVAQELGAMVAPAIRAGVSPNHIDFPGTITIHPQVFIGLVKDYCRSLHRHGFRKIVLINGHGGNTPCLVIAVRELQAEMPSAQLLTLTWWEFMPEEVGEVVGLREGLHANKFETSVVLAAEPRLVHMEKALKDVSTLPKEFLPGHMGIFLTNIRSFKEFTDSGVIGDPTEATAELGQLYLEKAAANIVKVLRELLAGKQ